MESELDVDEEEGSLSSSSSVGTRKVARRGTGVCPDRLLVGGVSPGLVCAWGDGRWRRLLGGGALGCPVGAMAGVRWVVGGGKRRLG